MSEHVTDPHGWPVDTESYDSPCAGDYEIRVTMGSKYPAPSIAVCIADGMEREQVHLTADDARQAAEQLLQAADILDAVTSGAYVPPPSTYVAPEQTPLQRAMMIKCLEGISKMMGTGR